MSRKEEIRALTRPDPFLTAATKVQEFVKAKRTALVGVVIAVVLLGAGATFAMSQRESAAAESSHAFAEAQEVFGQAPKSEVQSSEQENKQKFKTEEEWVAAATEKFSTVVEKYPSSGAANLSQLYLGALAMSKRDFAEAEKHYRSYLDKLGSKDELSFAARLGLASSLEDQHKLDDASVEYKKLVPAKAPEAKAGADEKDKEKEKLTPPGADSALLALGRIAEEQEKPKEAREYYDKLTKDYAQSLLRFKAQARLQALPKE